MLKTENKKEEKRNRSEKRSRKAGSTAWCQGSTEQREGAGLLDVLYSLASVLPFPDSSIF